MASALPACALAALVEAVRAGRDRIALVQRPWANRIGAELGADEHRNTLATMQSLIAAIEADQATQDA